MFPMIGTPLENTDKKGTCVYEKDIQVSYKGQGAATNREKGQGVTWTRAGAAPCKNGLTRTLLYIYELLWNAFNIYYYTGRVFVKPKNVKDNCF